MTNQNDDETPMEYEPIGIKSRGSVGPNTLLIFQKGGKGEKLPVILTEWQEKADNPVVGISVLTPQGEYTASASVEQDLFHVTPEFVVRYSSSILNRHVRKVQAGRLRPSLAETARDFVDRPYPEEIDIPNPPNYQPRKGTIG